MSERGRRTKERRKGRTIGRESQLTLSLSPLLFSLANAHHSPRPRRPRRRRGMPASENEDNVRFLKATCHHPLENPLRSTKIRLSLPKSLPLAACFLTRHHILSRRAGRAARLLSYCLLVLKGYHRTGAQRMILSVFAPSFDTDRKSLNESAKIGAMNQNYSWPR